MFDIDWQGTQQIVDKMPNDLVRVFILPPSANELRERLIRRAQDPMSVVASRMAEASKEIKSLLKESEEEGVHYHFSMKSGNPEKEIVDYVNDHRNVVLTIYDVSEQGADQNANISEKKNALAKITKGLSVPLVTVHT